MRNLIKIILISTLFLCSIVYAISLSYAVQKQDNMELVENSHELKIESLDWFFCSSDFCFTQKPCFVLNEAKKNLSQNFIKYKNIYQEIFETPPELKALKSIKNRI